MKLYCGIDLHSNNSYIGIVNSDGKRIAGRRLPNELVKVIKFLEPYREDLVSVAVESTFNWYWLVDGLMDKGYNVELVNPAGVDQYDGLKKSDDETDAFFMAELSRLGILPTGYIYPKDERPVRDILRRRTMFVHQRIQHTLSLKSLFSRHTGRNFGGRELNRLSKDKIADLVGGDENLIFMTNQNTATIRLLTVKINEIEKHVKERASLKPEFERLLTVPGIGLILGLTIQLETGDIRRFAKAGNYTSYCRATSATCTSNDKKKGENNRKNGNKYLSWAYVEAAHCAIRYCREANSFYQRKKARNGGAVATKALSSKYTKAVYYILNDGVEFDVKKMFG